MTSIIKVSETDTKLQLRCIKESIRTLTLINPKAKSVVSHLVDSPSLMKNMLKSQIKILTKLLRI